MKKVPNGLGRKITIMRIFLNSNTTTMFKSDKEVISFMKDSGVTQIRDDRYFLSSRGTNSFSIIKLVCRVHHLHHLNSKI